MNIVSYRGSGAAGGVSSTLAQAERCSGIKMGDWIHLHQGTISSISQRASARRPLFTLPAELVDGHYRYCNEFLWPIMHDMPQYARYDGAHHRAYLEFNSCLATVSFLSAANNRSWFVNDYQLALTPRLLRSGGAYRTAAFWHIPWPKNVPQDAIPFVAQVAEGLLAASVLGFHTEEYVSNFKRFVRMHLPEYFVDDTEGDIIRKRRKRSSLALEHTTEVTSVPLGIDTTMWAQLADREERESADFLHELTGGKPFVLSVDRADYTKGVRERLDAIDKFFECNQHLIGELNFVQICQKSRAGLPQFDQYWRDVRQRASQINSRFSEGEWTPITWVEQTVTPHMLARLYRSADIMLINAVRDGLNLTAKEFVACQTGKPGVLILSNQTGVYHEFRDHALTIDPRKQEDYSAALERSLRMSLKEKTFRINSLQRNLKANTLERWWQTFLEVESTVDTYERRARRALEAV